MTTYEQTQAVVELPLSEIRPGNNDRKRFDEAGLVELAGSIRKNGLLQPITVRKAEDGFEIVAGERRFRAHELLKAPTIKAIVAELDDQTASAMMLTENMSRVDLDPIEEAKAYRARMQLFGVDEEELAESIGVGLGRVRSRLGLLTLNGEIQELVSRGQFPVGFAEGMFGLDANRQRKAMEVLGGSNLTGAEFWQLCENLLAQQGSQPLFDLELVPVAQLADEAKEANVHLHPKQLAELFERILDGYAELVPADRMTDELAVLVQRARATIDFRLRKPKPKPKKPPKADDEAQ